VIRCLIPILPYLALPIFGNPVQEGDLPCKKFDQLHAPEEFLKQFRPLVRPHHRRSPGLEQGLHDHALYRCENYEDGEPCQCTRPQIGQQKTETGQHLDRSRPEHVEEATTEIYSRDVGGNVID
jgi:hypothetical protein